MSNKSRPGIVGIGKKRAPANSVMQHFYPICRLTIGSSALLLHEKSISSVCRARTVGTKFSPKDKHK